MRCEPPSELEKCRNGVDMIFIDSMRIICDIDQQKLQLTEMHEQFW